MKNPSRVRFLVFLLFIALVIVVWAETLVVKVQTTNLRKEPKFYSTAVALLQAGQALERLEAQAGWFRVKTAKGLTGWVHSSAVEGKKFDLLALDKSLKTKATAEEVALASKGFNKQVEEKYRAQNSQLSFAWVDKMLKIKVSSEEVKEFLRKGKLGELGGQK